MDPLRLQNKTNNRSISGRASGLGSKKQQRFSIKLLSVFFNFLSTKATYSQSSFYFKNQINFSMLNLGVSFFMFFFNYSIDFLYPKVLSGQKGFTLKYTSNIVTPKLHTSTLLVNLLFSSKRISGAQYKGVPDMLQSYYFSQDTPKSLILQTLSFLIIFSGFMSRCIIFLLWIDLSPSQTSQRTLMSSAWEISRLASIQFLREHSPSSNTMQASLSIFLGQGQIYSQPMYWMTNLLPSNSFCIRISASTISLMMGSLQFFTIFNAQLLLRLSFARQTAAAPPSPMIPQILYSTPAITIFSFIIFKQYLQLQSTKQNLICTVDFSYFIHNRSTFSISSRIQYKMLIRNGSSLSSSQMIEYILSQSNNPILATLFNVSKLCLTLQPKLFSSFANLSSSMFWYQQHRITSTYTQAPCKSFLSLHIANVRAERTSSAQKIWPFPIPFTILYSNISSFSLSIS